MSIELNDFKHIPGENDAEYIKLLEDTLEKKQHFIRKNIAWIEKLYHNNISNNWIPCTPVTMPEEDNWLGGLRRKFSERVLVSVLNSADEDEWVDVSQTIDGEWVLELPRHCKVVAWMPLPSPYQSESEG